MQTILIFAPDGVTVLGTANLPTQPAPVPSITMKDATTGLPVVISVNNGALQTS